MQIIRDFRPYPPVSTAGCAPCLHPPRRKCSFRRFWFIRHGGNTVFAVFYFSAAAETLFFSFFAFQPRRK